MEIIYHYIRCDYCGRMRYYSDNDQLAKEKIKEKGWEYIEGKYKCTICQTEKLYVKERNY